MSIYKMMKVFDCQWNPGMPENVKKAFFAIYKEKGNNVYVSHTVNGDKSDPDNEDNPFDNNLKLLDNWLIENGADAAKNDHSCGETVIIYHWW